jgi:hypothetical protein
MALEVYLQERALKGILRRLGIGQVVAEVVVQLHLVPVDEVLERLMASAGDVLPEQLLIRSRRP